MKPGNQKRPAHRLSGDARARGFPVGDKGYVSRC